MPYRVFISTTVDEQTMQHINTVKKSLWALKDFPVAPTTMEDIAESDQDPQTLIQQAIDDADIFIGIYGSSFGDYRGLNVADLIEYEYMYALERGLSPIIFMPMDYNPDDERMAQFRDQIQTRQIIHKFADTDDLKAKLTVAVTNFRKNQRKRPQKIDLPDLNLNRPRDRRRADDDANFEGEVMRAYDLIEDDLEDMIQRVIAVQDAKRAMQMPELKGTHKQTVNPIFGEPNNNVQFQSDIFMIMPFRDYLDAVYRDVVVPTVNDMNLTIKRGDEFSSVSGQIMSEVWAAINACRLVIVETTEVNANVYYELGIAHTLGKPAILITQGKDIEDFPFDIRHLRFIVYEKDSVGIAQLEAGLKQSIINIINDLEDGN